MQMSRNYLTTNRKLRASQLRSDARQLERAGFSDSAAQNYELAEMLCPTPRDESPAQEQHNDAGKTRKGENKNNGVATTNASTHRSGPRASTRSPRGGLHGGALVRTTPRVQRAGSAAVRD